MNRCEQARLYEETGDEYYKPENRYEDHYAIGMKIKREDIVGLIRLCEEEPEEVLPVLRRLVEKTEEELNGAA